MRLQSIEWWVAASTPGFPSVSPGFGECQDDIMESGLRKTAKQAIPIARIHTLPIKRGVRVPTGFSDSGSGGITAGSPNPFLEKKTICIPASIGKEQGHA
jgi:hypothetical protein